MKSHTFKRVARFGISGLMATGVHVLVAVLFINLVTPNPPLANGVAFAVATLFSYTVQSLWTFSSNLGGKTLSRFIVVSLVGCAMSVSISWIAESNALPYWIGIAWVVMAVPPITFVLHSAWTYR